MISLAQETMTCDACLIEIKKGEQIWTESGVVRCKFCRDKQRRRKPIKSYKPQHDAPRRYT